MIGGQFFYSSIQRTNMVQQSVRLIGILAAVALIAIWIGFAWGKFTMDLSIDYSVKTVATAAGLMLLSYVVSLLAPKKIG